MEDHHIDYIEVKKIVEKVIPDQSAINITTANTEAI